MASSFETFKDLDLTKDEVERITDALKDKNFRKLLTEYVDEIKDPENQKLYQKEITELEKQRGVDVTFINPAAGYVIKTSANGNVKAFINICTNENIKKPSSNVTFKDGTRGLQWSLPHSLAPPREDIDNKGIRCQVYDVVFHPDTLHLAQKNKAFRVMINKTACNAVESNFEITLDQKNLRFPKLQYKGTARAAVIRQPSKEPTPELNAEDKALMDKLYAQIDADHPPKAPKRSPRKLVTKHEENTNYTSPKYLIKHRRHIEMEEFTEHKTAKINTATPKELVVEIDLPLLKSANDIDLDVTEKTLQLISEKPAKYKLSVTLPYRIHRDIGNAKFDKDSKKLIVTLPVKSNVGFMISDLKKDDSGVESDHGSNTSISPVEEVDPNSLVTVLQSKETPSETNIIDAGEKEGLQFLNPDLCYLLPDFSTNIFKDTVAFTFHVKNVNKTSISKFIDKTESEFHIQFSSISAGFFPTYYAFYVQFLHHYIDKDKITVDMSDNNVIVKISCKPSDCVMTSYLFGLDKNELSEKYLEEPSIINDVFLKVINEDVVVPHDNPVQKKECKGKKQKKKGKKVPKSESTAIIINKVQCESSSDEISCSFSPTKSRGILKSLSNSRRFGRSISESGLDEVTLGSSIENCASIDSIIPEEGEMSTSLKKTVRFNSVVSRQLFRSNASILGQRKKNQRKALAKKRAQQRRHSEGEVVDVGNEKGREVKTDDDDDNEVTESSGKSSDEVDINIFELDLSS